MRAIRGKSFTFVLCYFGECRGGGDIHSSVERFSELFVTFIRFRNGSAGMIDRWEIFPMGSTRVEWQSAMKWNRQQKHMKLIMIAAERCATNNRSSINSKASKRLIDSIWMMAATKRKSEKVAHRRTRPGRVESHRIKSSRDHRRSNFSSHRLWHSTLWKIVINASHVHRSPDRH